MSGASIRLFRVAGIDVRVHASWLVVFALITWSLATAWYQPNLPGADPSQAWLLGALSAVLLFASVLIHELAHSFVARARGMEAHSITLFIFGGVSTLKSDAPRPSTEFLVAIVGPISSFALALLAYLAAESTTEPRLELIFSYLFTVNLLLGAFNLIPGFPLDGGRVLRSIVWQVSGDTRRGLEIAVNVGQVVGYGFMLWGFVRVLNDDLLGGLWIAAIGWFLQGAGQSTLQATRQESALRGLRVRDLYRPDTVTISPEATLSELIDGWLVPGNRRAVPVAVDGRLVGMVTVADLHGIPPEARASTRVGEVMGGRDAVVTASPDSRVSDVLRSMVEGRFEQVPVVDGGRLVGILGLSDVAMQLQLREALGLS
jgi:Zn-dependent protease/predicted transcriptional regulator